jgi:RNA ligase (TIGR02306 family)
MHKLATVEIISEIKTHTNADALELAMIRGWQVVVRKGEFQVGDLVVYLEIDSWVPTEIAPFLSKDKEPRVYEGIKGERLHTVKLRGEISQGLILPISILDPYLIKTDQSVPCAGRRIWDEEFQIWVQCIVPLEVGADATELLGVIKWEPPISAQLAGQVEGNFPSFIRRTDQENCQNCYNEMAFLNNHQHGGICWVIEEKLDGSSCTVYARHHRDVAEGLYEVGICSRNLELKINEENKDNTFINTVTKAGYLDQIYKLEESIAIQGELCGPGIQDNKYKLEHHVFFVFDVFLIDKRRYATREERWDILQSLIALGVKVDQVPHLGSTKIPSSIQECLTMADGNSKINPQTKREGIVFKTQDVIEGQVVSFKAISNQFLLQYKKK